VLIARVTSVGKGITLDVIYRLPSSNIFRLFEEMDILLNSGTLGDSFILCGDLNCPEPVET